MFKKGEQHHNWKGDTIKYRGLHKWITRHLGKPQECEMCYSTEIPNGKDKNKWFQWANATGEYNRKRKNWKRVCYICHRKIDSDTRPRGHRHPFARLTEKQVRIIKHALSFNIRGTQKWLAKMCGVNQQEISKISLNKKWKHIII